MLKKSILYKIFFLLTFFSWIMPIAHPDAWGDEVKLIKGQTIYLPIYSNIVIGERKQTPFDLSVNVSIRNTDPNHSITIVTTDYYNSEGKLVKRYLEKPETLGPMASTYHYIKQSDTTGGWGANFIIKWWSETEVNRPIIESVTYGSRGTHSVSFITRGQAIKIPSDP